MAPPEVQIVSMDPSTVSVTSVRSAAPGMGAGPNTQGLPGLLTKGVEIILDTISRLNLALCGTLGLFQACKEFKDRKSLRE